MTFPERFSNLPEYAFPRLRQLLDAHAPGGDVVHMSIGEPKHPFPEWVPEILAQHVSGFSNYPPNGGTPELLQAISGYYARRNGVELDPQSKIMALNGSREGLFNAALALCPEQKNGDVPLVLTPNPFYQVYAVGALAAGAEPMFVNATPQTGFLPDYAALPAKILDRAAVVFICSPSNPEGAVATEDYAKELILLAEKHDFRIFSDECYSEIYEGTPPPSFLAIAEKVGADPNRVVIFNSLSKRSNVPGLRSGFVASGPEVITQLVKLRTYSGAPLPLPLQRLAEHLWADDQHVVENRKLYAQKYQIAREIFGDLQGQTLPNAGFFLWLNVENGEDAALKIWRETGIRTLPGAYLSRDTEYGNPGQGYLRVAMVAPKQETQSGLMKIRDCLYN